MQFPTLCRWQNSSFLLVKVLPAPLIAPVPPRASIITNTIHIANQFQEQICETCGKHLLQPRDWRSTCSSMYKNLQNLKYFKGGIDCPFEELGCKFRHFKSNEIGLATTPPAPFNNNFQISHWNWLLCLEMIYNEIYIFKEKKKIYNKSPHAMLIGQIPTILQNLLK